MGYNRTPAWVTAASAFRVAGKPAVPFLRRTLSEHDPRTRVAAAVALDYIGMDASAA